MASFAIALVLLSATLFARLTRIIARAQQDHFADAASQPPPEVAPIRPGVRLIGG
ncbi:MAG TPA: hypothetical protein VFS87_05230 [Qipengyuania sp.]|nr:hypothetical protein [Qipengyuania sp.]